MTYWVLPRSGIPISTDTVQAVTNAELQTDVVKEQMRQWKAGTSRFLDAKSTNIEVVPQDDIPQHMIFDLQNEDEEFLRGFNMPITVEEADDEDVSREGAEEPDVIGDDLNATNYVGMEIGLRRGNQGELQRARVKRRATGDDAIPVGIAHTNPMLDTRKYEVEFEDGTSEILAVNLLAENILEQVDKHGHKQRMLDEINASEILAANLLAENVL